MSSTVSSNWREKATGFFSTSGSRIKQAGQSAGTFMAAGTFMGEVAKDTGSLVKNRWDILQRNKSMQPKFSGESVQERFVSVAASTGTLLKRSLSETKDKVNIGKMKVEEAAKKTADKSKIIFNNIERWQKGVADNDGRSPFWPNDLNSSIEILPNNMFGVPIEVVVQKQKSSKPVPEVLIKCAEYLILSGLNTEYLFKMEGDEKMMRHLMSLYNHDWNAPLPDGVHPINVAALIKCYLSSLPEPLTTFDLHHEIRDVRSSIDDLRNILKTLPNVNYMTLEFITALLLQVNQKSSLNKMDVHSLSVEFAPILIWKKGNPRNEFVGHSSIRRVNSNPKAMEFAASRTAEDNLSDDEDNAHVSSLISLDDGVPTDYGAIEVIHCLIEHHNAIFTDANETIWK